MGADHPRDHRRLIVVALYALSAFWGFVQVLSTNALVYVLCSLLFAVLAASWCVHDAWRRGQPLPPVIQMIIFLTWVVAVPVYLVSSRKLHGLGLALLHALGLIVTMGVSFYATLYCLY